VLKSLSESSRTYLSLIIVLFIGGILAHYSQSDDSAIVRAFWPACVALFITIITRQAVLGLLFGAKGDSKKRLEGVVAGLGCLCFFDGLANSLLVGRITKPLADKLRVPRAKLAYIVDSTSSSVACVAFISTWIATQDFSSDCYPK